MFRVAEFEKIKGKQVFKQFAYKGYKIDQGGVLTHYKKKISQRDKRRKNYVEFNMYVGQNDIKQKPIYTEDYVFDHTNKVHGLVKFYPNLGAYILRVDAGRIQIPYSMLDTSELQVEVMGNIYENERTKNEWKK